MKDNALWNFILKIVLLLWLYTGKILLTIVNALFWDLELPFARIRYQREIRSFSLLDNLKKTLSKHFNYRNDPMGGLIDYYYLPHITWALRRGDCDDFALMAADALVKFGLKTFMVTFIPNHIRNSHVIVIYRNGHCWAWAESGIWHDELYSDINKIITVASDSLGGLKASHIQTFAL